jgi:CDP-paratose synthetase
MKKEYILLTGSAGFLGSKILQVLIKNKYNIITLRRKSTDTKRIKNLSSKYINFNVENLNYENFFKKYKIKCIIHAAVQYNRKNETITQIYDGNLIFGADLLNSAIKYKVKYFINTDTYYEKYKDSYSISKKHFKELLFFYRNKINIINLKIAHMYGPNDNNIKFLPSLLNQFKINIKNIEILTPYEYKDFIFIDDVVDCYLKIIKNISIFKNKYYDLNIGMNRLVSMKKFVITSKKIYNEFKKETKTVITFKKNTNKIVKKSKLSPKHKILKEIKWFPKTSIKKGLIKTITSKK